MSLPPRSPRTIGLGLLATLVGLFGMLEAPFPAVARPMASAQVWRAGPFRPHFTRREMARARPIPPLRRARPVGRRHRRPVGARPMIAGPRPRAAWNPSFGPGPRSRVGRAAQSDPSLEGYIPAGSYPAFVGRLYVKTLDGTIRYCSAAIVAPSVVLTAAHCVMDGTRSRFNDWFAFVPGQEGASLPHGLWWARSALVSQYYGRDGSATHDFAFLVMYPSRGAEGGVRVGDVLGWVPPLIDSTTSQALHVGYPAGGPFARLCSGLSCLAWYCYAPIADFYVGDAGAVVGLPCHTSFGSSGGPWFELYAGAWYVASDVSSGSGGGDLFGEVWGPYFEADTLSVYRAALSASPS